IGAEHERAQHRPVGNHAGTFRLADALDELQGQLWQVQRDPQHGRFLTPVHTSDSWIGRGGAFAASAGAVAEAAKDGTAKGPVFQCAGKVWMRTALTRAAPRLFTT